MGRLLNPKKKVVKHKKQDTKTQTIDEQSGDDQENNDDVSLDPEKVNRWMRHYQKFHLSTATNIKELSALVKDIIGVSIEITETEGGPKVEILATNCNDIWKDGDW